MSFREIAADSDLGRLLTATALEADLESSHHGSTLCPRCDSDLYFSVGSPVPQYVYPYGEQVLLGWIPAAKRCAACNFNTIYRPGSRVARKKP